MLRVNVATRPFYNERGVHALLAAVGLLLVGVGVFNAAALATLTGREQALGGQITTQETRAQSLRQDAQKVRGSIRQDELQAVLAAAREANGLIDLRTFSWTELFNHLEATLPEDVMLTTVRPTVDDGNINLTLGVVGQRVAAIDQFMTKLETTGVFRDVLSRDEQALEDGGFEAVVVAAYDPGAVGEPTATPATASVEPAASENKP